MLDQDGQIGDGWGATIGAFPDDRAVLVGLLVILFVLLLRVFRRSRQKAEFLQKKDIEIDVYRRAMEAHAMVNISAADGSILYVNETLAKTTGYTEQELIGRRFRDLLLADPTVVPAHFRDWIRSGKTWVGESKIRRKDGSYLWTRSTIVPVLDTDGTLLRTISLRTDITESKVLQAELQERMMLDRLRDEVYVLSTETLELLYLNKRSLQLMNWTAKDIVGKRLSDVSSSFDEAAFRSRGARLLSGEAEAVLYETTKNDVPIEVSLQLDRTLDGTTRFVSVVRDISERKRAERDKAEFVATVSHELRSPLTSIKGALNLLASGAVGPVSDRSGTLMNVALRNVDRLVRLINDLLDLEKLDANMMDMRFETVDLVAFAEDAVAANAGFGHEYGVTVRRVGSKSPVFASISRDGMMQVLTNLISNAIKFSDAGQCVDLGVIEDADCVRLVIVDHGPGIAPEAQKLMFARFVQLHPQDDQRRNGTGLGLSIAKSIVEKHAGRISFTSEVGRGTSFFIDLPKINSLQAVA